MRFFPLLAALLLACAPAFAADAVPAGAYFPVLPFDAPPDTAPQWIPVAANHPLDVVHSGITRAIITIHDQSRDAASALSVMTALAGGANGQTMIIAPQFLLPSDLARFADHLPDKGKTFAAWDIAGWASGDDAAALPAHKGVSSFTAVDLILMYLADRNAFPDLQAVSIAGYGAGANFVQRYAAFGLAADMLAQQKIDVRFIVAGATSYLYMTGNRPLAGGKGFGRPDVAACPVYNNYPYGLDNLNAYGRRVGANAAKTNYALRFITYLTAPGTDPVPDTSCAAMDQGADALTRAMNDGLYMQSLYGDAGEKMQSFVIAKDSKNDAVGLFGSSCSMEVLFGDGVCPHHFGEMK